MYQSKPPGCTLTPATTFSYAVLPTRIERNVRLFKHKTLSLNGITSHKISGWNPINDPGRTVDSIPVAGSSLYLFTATLIIKTNANMVSIILISENPSKVVLLEPIYASNSSDTSTYAVTGSFVTGTEALLSVYIRIGKLQDVDIIAGSTISVAFIGRSNEGVPLFLKETTKQRSYNIISPFLKIPQKMFKGIPILGMRVKENDGFSHRLELSVVPVAGSYHISCIIMLTSSAR